MSIKFGRSGNGYDSSQVMETADDDWRQTTDLALRRKIQNRLAQRNYRRKLRQRLEDLERLAGENSSSSALTSTSSSSSTTSTKSTKSTPSHTTTTAAATKVTKRTRANSARTIRTTTDDGLRLQVPRPKSAEPVSAITATDDSPITPTTNASFSSLPFSSRPNARNYYGADFGPLFVAADRSVSAAPSYQTDLWEPEQQYVNQFTPIGGYASNREYHSGQDFPELPSSYSANPTVNPNVFHVNPPMTRDHFYMSLNYNKLVNASMQVGKILNVSQADMYKDETLSPFIKQEPFDLPDHVEDLHPTERQLSVPHHPYIDVIPFKGFRNCMLDYSVEGERTGNYGDEERLCADIHESWGVWGETPWESRSYEIGEDFARNWWFLVDNEMLRSSNYWRRQRGLKRIDLKTIVAEALAELKVGEGGFRGRAWLRFRRLQGRVLGEVVDEEEMVVG